MKTIANLIISALSLMLVSKLVTGVTITDFGEQCSLSL